MKNAFLRLTSNLILLLILLTACQSDPGIIPTHDPQLPRIVRATDRKTGIVEVQIPDGWFGIEGTRGSITVANSGTALRRYENGIETLESGMIAGTVRAFFGSALPPHIDPEDLSAVGNYVAGQIAAPHSDMHYTFGSPQVRSFDQADGVIYDGLGTGAGVALEVRLMIVRTADQTYGILFFVANFGEMEAQFDKLDFVGQSFHFIRFEQITTQEAQSE